MVTGYLADLCPGPPNISNATFKAYVYKKGTVVTFQRKPVIPKPEDQEERKRREIQSQMEPLDQANLLGHCREPPPWEHEALEKKYHFVVGQTVHYQCIEGYRAQGRGSAKSTCRIICGEARWTQPQLTCTNKVIPGKEEAEPSVDTHPESEISCFSTTVASCVFLLISILLLSGLTWQQKW
ncbi:interleukin-2 receptor subunit alpha [Rhynchocyon petersi]